MVGLLALADDRACEAELAAALDVILSAGDLPELTVLQQRFMLSSTLGPSSWHGELSASDPDPPL